MQPAIFPVGDLASVRVAPWLVISGMEDGNQKGGRSDNHILTWHPLTILCCLVNENVYPLGRIFVDASTSLLGVTVGGRVLQY